MCSFAQATIECLVLTCHLSKIICAAASPNVFILLTYETETSGYLDELKLKPNEFSNLQPLPGALLLMES